MIKRATLAVFLALALALPARAQSDASNPTIQQIDNEVRDINIGLPQEQAFQLPPKCETYGPQCSWWKFTTVFKDKDNHVRKIIEWSEGGIHNPGVAGPSTEIVHPTIRSVWETYYDINGNPILMYGRYDGLPGDNRTTEHMVYMHGDEVVQVLDGLSTSSLKPGSNTSNQPVVNARKKLQEVTAQAK